jgi:DNA-binding transcriptional MocR family regulator
MDNSSTTEPSAARLTDLLRAEIRRRRPGDRLPSTRALVEELKVSPVTVSRSFAALIAEGLVVTRPGAGSYVAAPQPDRAPADYSWQTCSLEARPIEIPGMEPLLHPTRDEGDISLSLGYLHPSLMPTRALSAALARASRLPDVWERPPANGIRALRSWVAQSAGPSIDPADVLITPGGQGGITTVLHAVLSSGEPLLAESPTYPGMMAAARAAGIRVVPVPTDSDGIIPELLAETFARTGARALYCQPLYQNPTGTVLSAPRRRAVLDVAAAVGAFVIEDDFARLLGHGGPLPPPLLSQDTDGRVIYITSLTKPVSPSLRIGAIISRGPVAARLRTMRVVDDMFIGRPIQEATIELVSRPSWPGHLRALAESLASRREALGRSVARRLPAVQVPAIPQGGLHLWVRLPAGSDDVSIAANAARQGVLVAPGGPFFPSEPPHSYLRLSYSGAPSEAHLDLGVERLAQAAPELTG